MLSEVNIGKRNRLLMDIANGRTLTRNWVHDADTIFYLSDENLAFRIFLLLALLSKMW